jgi:hypothetical protein
MEEDENSLFISLTQKLSLSPTLKEKLVTLTLSR